LLARPQVGGKFFLSFNVVIEKPLRPFGDRLCRPQQAAEKTPAHIFFCESPPPARREKMIQSARFFFSGIRPAAQTGPETRFFEWAGSDAK